MLKKVLIRGPVLSQSGYGEQCRFALNALAAFPERFEIFLENISWGRTGWIDTEHKERELIEQLLGKTQLFKNHGGVFDISLQVTIPNEFEKLAPLNVGYTAGIETTKIAPQWIEKTSLMDRLIVVSDHAKYGFDNTTYTGTVEATGVKVEVKNQVPVHVVNYCTKDTKPLQVSLGLETDFNFLTVAQWGVRKNLEATIFGFLEEFGDTENVGLVLKTSIVKNNLEDRRVCEGRLRRILDNFKDLKCKVYLLHGNMSEEEVLGLYNNPKIKAFISTSHGEGFGLPLFEAAYSGLPIISPNWSGQIDFLYAPKKDKKTGKSKNKPHFTKIDYELKPVQKEVVWEGVIVADSKWCYVKPFSVKNSLRSVYKNYGSAVSTAKRLKEHILEEFTPAKIYKQFADDVFVATVQDEEWESEVNEIDEE